MYLLGDLAMMPVFKTTPLTWSIASSCLCMYRYINRWHTRNTYGECGGLAVKDILDTSLSVHAFQRLVEGKVLYVSFKTPSVKQRQNSNYTTRCRKSQYPIIFDLIVFVCLSTIVVRCCVDCWHLLTFSFWHRSTNGQRPETGKVDEGRTGGPSSGQIQINEVNSVCDVLCLPGILSMMKCVCGSVDRCL